MRANDSESRNTLKNVYLFEKDTVLAEGHVHRSLGQRPRKNRGRFVVGRRPNSTSSGPIVAKRPNMKLPFSHLQQRFEAVPEPNVVQ